MGVETDSGPAAMIRRTENTGVDHLGQLLMQVALRLRRVYSFTLAEYGLYPREHAILSSLDTAGAASQRELSGRTGIDPGDLVACLDRLQGRGLARRERDTRDRRRSTVTITDDGRRTLAASDQGVRRLERSVFGPLAEDLSRDLGVIRDRLVRYSPLERGAERDGPEPRYD